MKKYTVNLEGFEGQSIEVQTKGIFPSPRLLVNGAPAPIDKKSGYITLQRNDGGQVRCKWKPKALGLDMPALDVEGKIIHITKPLKWFVWIWCALPIVLLFVGGAIGAVTGFIGAVVNFTIFRSGINIWARFALTAVVTVLAVLIYIIGATLLTTALGR